MRPKLRFQMLPRERAVVGDTDYADNGARFFLLQAAETGVNPLHAFGITDMAGDFHLSTTVALVMVLKAQTGAPEYLHTLDTSDSPRSQPVHCVELAINGIASRVDPP